MKTFAATKNFPNVQTEIYFRILPLVYSNLSLNAYPTVVYHARPMGEPELTSGQFLGSLYRQTLGSKRRSEHTSLSGVIAKVSVSADIHAIPK